ncbi:MAG: RluA family pseudouridine synthase [Candidatus Aminicenantes bacterium]|nr:RluA family pseudouridine synthase [Candidatus Aminicenantes bacterium]
MDKKFFRITPEFGEGIRLDVFLCRQVREFTRAQFQRFIDKEQVRVNGGFKKSSYTLRAGDLVEAEVEMPPLEPMAPQLIPLDILYADEHLAVINKPSGLLVHPGAGRRFGTLVNALLYHFPEVRGIGPEDRLGIVHRLDRETSGVIITARSPLSYQAMKRQFKNREVKKVYLALVWGHFRETEGTIDLPIGRHLRNGQKFSVETRKPRVAITDYTVLKRFAEFDLVEARPHTGRTHQIRVHMAAGGHPVAGDRVYGPKRPRRELPRLFLHARKIGFRHPESEKWLEFEAPLPPDLERFLASLEAEAGD